MPYVAILNSRQSKTPIGDDPWVGATLQAVRYAINHGLTIVSSIGLNTWELVTWATGEYGGKLLIYVPFPPEKNLPIPNAIPPSDQQSFEQCIIQEFNLDPLRTEFFYQKVSTRAKGKKAAWPARDSEIISLVDRIYPISLRPDGILAELIGRPNVTTKTENGFRVDYLKKRGVYDPLPNTQPLNPLRENDKWDYITHWTRSTNGKWPGETSASYYRDLVQSQNNYPRSALNTLLKIIEEKRIRASRRRIRGAFPVVSFSAHPPGDAVKLMRWRRRFVRWNFEPYGIAITREVAQSAGIRPVVYGVPSNYKDLKEEDCPYFQSIGVRGGDWTPENEWRHLGDFDLSRIPAAALKIIVRSSGENARIKSTTPVEIFPLLP